ncbi:unnamed protein product [Tenebrio molitor]|nr:unnamed protein product [Tenebrio molitor]
MFTQNFSDYLSPILPFNCSETDDYNADLITFRISSQKLS